METINNPSKDELRIIIHRLKVRNSGLHEEMSADDIDDTMEPNYHFENADLQQIIDKIDDEMLYLELSYIRERSLLDSNYKREATLQVSRIYVKYLKEVVKIDEESTMVYLKNEYGVFDVVKPLRHVDFTSFIVGTMPPTNFNTDSLFSSIANFVKTELKCQSNKKITQFNDCYIDGTSVDGTLQVREGVYDGIAHHYVSRYAYNTLTSGKTNHQSREIDDFLNHISNQDEEVREYLLYMLSTMFINTSEMKKKYATTILNFYGENGQNGKSTLCELIEKVLNHTEQSNNYVSSGIDEWHDKNTLLSVAKSMVVADLDANSDVLNNKNTSIIKKIASGDSINVKQLYVDQFSMKPTTLVIVCSNSDIRSFEKSGGWNRRLEKFKIDEQLNRDGKWFMDLYSKESLDYLFDLLLIYFKNMITSDDLPKKPQAIIRTKNEYIYNENNVLQFLDYIDLSQITNTSTNLAFRMYSEWCFREMIKPLAQRTFVSTITTHTSLTNKAIRGEVIAKDSTEGERDEHGNLKTVSHSLYQTVNNGLIVGPYKEIGEKARFTCFMEGE